MSSEIRVFETGNDAPVQPPGASKRDARRRNSASPLDSAARPPPDLITAMLDASPDCIKLLDLDGRLRFANRNGVSAMKIDEFDVAAGTPWPDLWPEENRHRVAAAVEAAAEGRTDRFEAFCPSEKGEPRWWDITIAPVPGDDGRPAQVMSISRDITERVERERSASDHEDDLRKLALSQARTLADKEQLIKEKTLLMQEVDHRVKNSLAMINALLRIQGRMVDDESAREALRHASARVQTIASVHERLYRDRSQGRLDLGEYLRALCSDLHASMGDAGVELRTDLHDLAEASAEEAVTLGLIVTELVTNAMRHARKADETCIVWVRCRPVAQGPHELVVEDDGCGLPDDFDPAASKGLGMRVVMGNVSRLGGTLAFEKPEKGDGTRFVVRF